MSKGTPPHSVRVAEEIWAAATEKAAADGKSVGDVIRELLDGWLAEKKGGKK